MCVHMQKHISYSHPPVREFMNVMGCLGIVYFPPEKCPQLLIVNIWDNGTLNKIECVHNARHT